MVNDRGERRIKVRVGPGKAGAIALIVMPLLFLAFGVVLFLSVLEDAGDAQPAIIMFAILWCTTMLMLLGYGVYTLMTPIPALDWKSTSSARMSMDLDWPAQRSWISNPAGHA